MGAVREGEGNMLWEDGGGRERAGRGERWEGQKLGKGPAEPRCLDYTVKGFWERRSTSR